VNDPAADDSLETQVDRFLVGQAIMLSLAGVPGIYFHSLFGSRNDRAAALATGINRRINRQKLTLAELETELSQARSLRTCVFEKYRGLLHARRSHAAFHPHAGQQVFAGDRRVFAVLRTATTERGWVLCLHSVTNEQVTLNITTAAEASARAWTELLSESSFPVSSIGTISVTLQPYAVNWFAAPGPCPLAMVGRE
jgi:sucrose phosphorylase